MNTPIKNTLLLFLSKGLFKLSYIINYFIIANSYGNRKLGIYVFIITSSLLIKYITSIGLDQLIKKKREEEQDIQHFIKNSINIKLILGILAILIISTYYQFYENEIAHMFIYSLIGISLFSSLSNTLMVTFDKKNNLRVFIIKIFNTLIISIITAIILIKNYQFEYLFITYMIFNIIEFLIMYTLTKNKNLFSPILETLKFLKKYRKELFSFLITTSAILIIYKTNIILTKWILDYEKLGFYTGGLLLMKSFNIFILSTRSYISSSITKFFKEKKKKYLQKIKKIYAYSLGISVALAIILYYVCDDIIPLILGEDFIISIKIFRHALIPFILFTLVVINMIILNSMDKEELNGNILLKGIIFSIIANIIMISTFEIMGAVHALTITFLFIIIMQSIPIIKKIRILSFHQKNKLYNLKKDL